jgi:predicted MFS family arabinose efflux permease
VNGRIFLLVLGTFAIGTECYVIAGLLPYISRDLGVSLSAAGQLVTAFSLAYAFGSPVLTTLTGRADKRRVLAGFAGSLLLFAAGNFVCGTASTYGVLLAGRIVTAVGAGLFAPAANYTAAALAAPDKRGRAIAVVLGGLTVALVFGVPLGTWMASIGDWRTTFQIVGAASVLAAALIRGFLPKVASSTPVSLGDRIRCLKRPLILTALLTTLAWGIGIFVAYTYVSDIFAGLGAAAPTIPLMLFIAGIASCFGVGIGGYAADRFGSAKTIVFALCCLIAALLSLSVFRSVALDIAAMAVWGFSGYTFNPAQQHRLIELSGKDAGIVLSLHNAFIYLGSALGSLIGGLVLQYGSAAELGFAGGVAVFTALMIYRISDQWAKKRPVPENIP